MVLTRCGGHTSHSGDPGSPGTARSSRTAHSSPLAPVSPAGNRQGEMEDDVLRFLLCPWLDPARDRTHPALWLPPHQTGHSGGEQAKPSQSPRQHACRQHFHSREAFTPAKFLPPLHLCLGAGCAGSGPRQLLVLARHPVAAAAPLGKGYQSFINCSSRFD